MASAGRASKPALQNSPGATAAEHERIRESVVGRKHVTAGPRRGVTGRGPLLIGLALVFILVAVGIATFMIVPRLAPPDRSTPQATITGYFDALKQDDFSRAWQFASASHNDTASQDVFTQNLRADDSRYGKVISFHILSVDTDGSNHATALVQTARANAPGSPVVYSIALSQFDGTTWLMDSIASQ
jgi:hypothetical protein